MNSFMGVTSLYRLLRQVRVKPCPGLRFNLLVSLAALLVISFPACSWFHHEPKPTPAQIKAREKRDKLEEKALAGDRKAARKLAQWHYLNDSTTQQAQYWLHVAERNGDKAAGLLATQMQDWR